MENTNERPNSMCKECVELQNGNRHSPAHQFLTKIISQPYTSQFGNVDEHYYKCTKCGKNWLFETGTYGQGWQ